MDRTLFASVYNRFLGKITDDMYMELTPEETVKDLQKLLIDAIPGFEFPKKSLDYDILVKEAEDGSQGFIIEKDDGTKYEDASSFTTVLSSEEINILAILMMISWLQRQITSVENIRMKYSSADFKMTSQANHIGKLLSLLAETQRQSKYAQRLYRRRRKDKDGLIVSNWDIFREDSAINGSVDDINNLDSYRDNEQEVILYGGSV